VYDFHNKYTGSTVNGYITDGLETMTLPNSSDAKCERISSQLVVASISLRC